MILIKNTLKHITSPDLSLSGGIAPHISPFVSPADLGSLLNGAKFCMITLDSEEITVTYPDMYFLLRDIQV